MKVPKNWNIQTLKKASLTLQVIKKTVYGLSKLRRFEKKDICETKIALTSHTKLTKVDFAHNPYYKDVCGGRLWKELTEIQHKTDVIDENREEEVERWNVCAWKSIY
ncbi:unnamed protein product [Arabis nemorensis]|uniref:Uncharacterized protein n=1 Tax=Arabis nemorensis TaxID=586526 RepID=A0A565CAP5_9BRAS|nr:unnamed protein product [Arabis nemorensis]